MESFLDNYLTSTYAEDVPEDVLLERRISPYATLRPGDLAGLLKLQSTLSFAGTGLTFLRRTPSLDKCGQETVQTDEVQSSLENVDEGDKDLRDVVCRGEDQNHVPSVYTVKGLRRHEMPVIGVFVDSRVCPGFRYRVRRAGSNQYFYKNEARTLESIGMGYGKRLTFTGDQLNNNECYFWSDSEPKGYAFSIHAVDRGQKFLIMDSEEAVVGECVVASINEPQEEISMKVDKDGVVKRVSVTLTCTLTYYHRYHHGLVDIIVHENQETISGEAILHKARRSRKSSLVAIENIFLQRFGECKFHPDC